MYKCVLYLGLVVCFSFCMQMSFAQKLQTFTDRNNILIGEQIKLTIKATLPANTTTISKWLSAPETIPHFDIVEFGKADTTSYKDNSIAIEQIITITSFDSGRWTFPPLPVEFTGFDGREPQMVLTDSFSVNVLYSPSDGSNELHDIKPIIQVTITDYFWYYIIGGALLLLLIAFLFYRYFKKKKTLEPTLTAVSQLSPFVEAMAALKKLDEINLQDAAEIKSYHIRLAEIFKIYLGRKQRLNLLNKTTGDLLIIISDINLSAENISDLATALRCTDAVKFAKYLPLSNQSIENRQKVQELITAIETIIQSNI